MSAWGAPSVRANDNKDAAQMLQELQPKINSFKAIVTNIEDKNNREKARHLREQLDEEFKTINRFLQSPEAKQNAGYQRLVDTFHDSMKRYKKVCEECILQERTRMSYRQSMLRGRGDSQAAQPANNVVHGQDDGSEDYKLQDLGLQQIGDTDLLILQEQDKDIRALESEIQELNKMFVEVAELSKDQAVMLDNAEQNIIVADQNVEKGAEDLHIGAERAKKKRLLIVIIIVIICVVIVVLLGILVGVICGSVTSCSSSDNNNNNNNNNRRFLT